MGTPFNICLNRQSITQATTKFCPFECQNASHFHSFASPPPCSGYIFHLDYGGGFLTLPALYCSVPIHSPNSKQNTLWKRESDHVTSLFKTSQMFPIDLLVNPLTWFYKTVVIYILLQLYMSSSSASATAYQSLPFFPSPVLPSPQRSFLLPPWPPWPKFEGGGNDPTRKKTKIPGCSHFFSLWEITSLLIFLISLSGFLLNKLAEVVGTEPITWVIKSSPVFRMTRHMTPIGLSSEGFMGPLRQ